MKTCLLLLFLTVAICPVRAGWLDALGLNHGATNPASSSALSALSSDQVTGGLKEALGNGLQHAIAEALEPITYYSGNNVSHTVAAA